MLVEGEPGELFDELEMIFFLPVPAEVAPSVSMIDSVEFLR